MQGTDDRTVEATDDRADPGTAAPPLVVDEARLERLEADLADAARTLEAVERIQREPGGPAERAEAIRSLVADGRFAVADPPGLVGSDPVESDLVGDGDVDAAQQVDAVAEDPTVGAVLDPAGPEVGQPLEG